ncbi:hypothetical protein [uncultured Methylobacterium sp.]|uniref:hypothetical protein n=1 Tax=uncultured Methylobacterium sp. TaxID=157278 RepID=UPI0035C9A617
MALALKAGVPQVEALEMRPWISPREGPAGYRLRRAACNASGYRATKRRGVPSRITRRRDRAWDLAREHTIGIDLRRASVSLTEVQ